MAEPLFRKGELLEWGGFEDYNSAWLRSKWGHGPFICDRDIFDMEECVMPTNLPADTYKACWAKRLHKAVFLNAVKEALAEADRG